MASDNTHGLEMSTATGAGATTTVGKTGNGSMTRPLLSATTDLV